MRSPGEIEVRHDHEPHRDELKDSKGDSWEETLYLQSIPDMAKSIREGLATDPDDCDSELEW